MKNLSDSEITLLKQRLLQEKKSLEEQLQNNDHFGLRSSEKEATGELSVVDNHPADMGSETFEKGKDIALNEHVEHRIEEIDKALNRMKEGTYGYCSICTQPIPLERLHANPAAEHCIQHTEKYESHRRPIEEEILSPPFSNYDFRPDNDSNNGDNAWEIVESTGTATSSAYDATEWYQIDNEPDDAIGFVEPIESFVATDLYGNHVSVVRNKQYYEWMENLDKENERTMKL
ncbi:TraR/DksA C4-type zinc finger protein [Longirhabdus pacifica]|uniref:TraR/DksA C4-type zinc finger protein n=1 Tax=Longirhabdus pacifica TaxID=2305227 RepID=UPI0013E8B7F4|nr:TraR/DksA C4-type zinc finger protein [Longirhabdus pacifica]